jgi:hypothetical protein
MLYKLWTNDHQQPPPSHGLRTPSPRRPASSQRASATRRRHRIPTAEAARRHGGGGRATFLASPGLLQCDADAAAALHRRGRRRRSCILHQRRSCIYIYAQSFTATGQRATRHQVLFAASSAPTYATPATSTTQRVGSSGGRGHLRLVDATATSCTQ